MTKRPPFASSSRKVSCLGFWSKTLTLSCDYSTESCREEQCKIEVVKQDGWYTYLAVKPKKVRRSGWFPDTFHDGRVVLMNKASDTVPQDMPRQLWYTDGINDYSFAIKSWRFNLVDSPKLEEFAKPEDRPGWKVLNWNKVKAGDIGGE